MRVLSPDGVAGGGGGGKVLFEAMVEKLEEPTALKAFTQ